MELRMKKCPFCGGEPYLADTWDGRIAVQCETCGCRTIHYDHKETAIHKWNQRVKPEPEKPKHKKTAS